MQTCRNLGYAIKLKIIKFDLKLCMGKDPDQRDYFVSNEKLRDKVLRQKYKSTLE